MIKKVVFYIAEIIRRKEGGEKNQGRRSCVETPVAIRTLDIRDRAEALVICVF